MPVGWRVYLATILPSVICLTLNFIIPHQDAWIGYNRFFNVFIIMGTFYMVVIAAPLQTLVFTSIYEQYKERADEYYTFVKLFVIGWVYTALVAFIGFVFYAIGSYMLFILFIFAPLVALAIEMFFVVFLPRVFSSEHFMNNEE